MASQALDQLSYHSATGSLFPLLSSVRSATGSLFPLLSSARSATGSLFPLLSSARSATGSLFPLLSSARSANCPSTVCPRYDSGCFPFYYEVVNDTSKQH